MPSVYAHILFAKKVLDRLDCPNRRLFTEQLDEYLVGSLGPDLLFFHPPVFVGSVAKVGSRLHASPVSGLLEPLRPLVYNGTPYAAAYAAGLICHYVSDHALHPTVDSEAAKARISHLGLETELDRYLAEQNGLDPLTLRPLADIEPNDRLFTLMRCIYPCTRQQLRAGWRGIRQTHQLLGSLGGSPLAGVVNIVRPTRGIILKKKADPACRAAVERYAQMLEDAVPTAVFLIDSYFLSVRCNAPLDSAFLGDFNGREGKGK